MNTTITLRASIDEQLHWRVIEAAKKSHECNYHKLHAHRDGSLTWFETINKSDDLIDGRADHFTAIKSLITVGTGSYACNCDYCQATKYATQADAIHEALCEGGWSDLAQLMTDNLNNIPVGYFEDEAFLEGDKL